MTIQLKAIVLSLAVVSASVTLPNHIDTQGIHYKPANAFLLKMAVGLAARESSMLVKGWLKSVAAKEGKHVALAAARALKTLPNDPVFRAAVLTALTGGGYHAVAGVVGNQAKQGASEQWQQDKQRLADNPDLMVESAEGYVKEKVVDQQDDAMGRWNNANDTYTCMTDDAGINLVRNESGHIVIGQTGNEDLLEGRALLQRALLTRMMANSSFTSVDEASKATLRYAKAACMMGKSKRVMAFFGGLSLKRHSIVDAQEKAINVMSKINVWAQKKL